MPTVRRQRLYARRPELRRVELALLMDEPEPAGLDESDRYWWHVAAHEDSDEYGRRGLWAMVGEELTRRFAELHPGRRPSAWWDYTAPRMPRGHNPRWDRAWFRPKLPLPRERLGGVGTPAHDVFSLVPWYEYGIPRRWVTPDEVELYSGRARDVHGRVLFPEWAERPFPGVAIDPADPPTYESQAAYLRRHGLLLPGESSRLRAADYKPEAIMPWEAAGWP